MKLSSACTHESACLDCLPNSRDSWGVIQPCWTPRSRRRMLMATLHPVRSSHHEDLSHADRHPLRTPDRRAPLAHDRGAGQSREGPVVSRHHDSLRGALLLGGTASRHRPAASGAVVTVRRSMPGSTPIGRSAAFVVCCAIAGAGCTTKRAMSAPMIAIDRSISFVAVDQPLEPPNGRVRDFVAGVIQLAPNEGRVLITERLLRGGTNERPES